MKRIILVALTFILVFGIVSAASAVSYWDKFKEAEYCEAQVWRFPGEDRIETAIFISQWNQKHSFHEPEDFNWDEETVIICRSDDYADALVAGALSGVLDEDADHCAPILLNPGEELDPRVKDEIERLWGEDDDDENILIVGGTGAISEDVEDELNEMSDSVERIGGDDRYETAVEAAEEMEDYYGHVDDVLICTGENWPDALAAAAYANAHSDWGSPCVIMLVEKNGIPGPTLDWLLAHKTDLEEVYVIGGEGAVSSDVLADLGYYLEADIERVWGDNRYETCLAVAEKLWGVGPDDDSAEAFVFATGDNFPDALAASTLQVPVTPTSSLDPAVEEWLADYEEEHECLDLFMAGGYGAVDKETQDEILEVIDDENYEPTTEEPTIKSVDVTINDGGGIDDIPDVAQYDPAESVEFDVTIDDKLKNEDGSFIGDGQFCVWIEDITELASDKAEADYCDYYGNCDDYHDLTYGDPLYLVTDNGPHWDPQENEDGEYEFWGQMDVLKKSTSPEQREVTFVAHAVNQAGSDTMESDSVEIYN